MSFLRLAQHEVPILARSLPLRYPDRRLMPIASWKHQTAWTGANLNVPRGMNSGSVEPLYLDAPFNCNSVKETMDQAAFMATLETTGLSA